MSCQRTKIPQKEEEEDSLNKSKNEKMCVDFIFLQRVYGSKT